MMTKYKINLIYTENSESLDLIFVKVITKELKEYLNNNYLSLKKGDKENER